jgi:hypothetical protein
MGIRGIHEGNTALQQLLAFLEHIGTALGNLRMNSCEGLKFDIFCQCYENSEENSEENSSEFLNERTSK